MRPAECSTDQAALLDKPAEPAWSVIIGDQTVRYFGSDIPRFTFHVPSEQALQNLLATDTYSAGIAFVHGDFDVEGDLAEAIRFRGWNSQSLPRQLLFRLIARGAAFIEGFVQTRSQAGRRIRFHYDRSNDFYHLFLDRSMVYSCAFFPTPETTLEDAQSAKLDRICRKLDLHNGDRFLDVGCGWGALLEHAVSQYGVQATGCTLSDKQYKYAVQRLNGSACVLEKDYRDLNGTFDKIASVGMFEHIGRHHASQYFQKIHDLLAPDGIFLNHAIARPEGVSDDASSLFLRRYIFPGGQFLHLGETIRAAEKAGFEVLDVENQRPHYAITCRTWEHRLCANRDAALRIVDQPTFRAWRIWLAASALCFEEGYLDVHQVLLGMHASARRRLIREL